MVNVGRGTVLCTTVGSTLAQRWSPRDWMPHEVNLLMAKGIDSLRRRLTLYTLAAMVGCVGIVAVLVAFDVSVVIALSLSVFMMLGFASIMSRIYAKNISEPVAEIIDVVTKITKGDLGARVKANRSDEVGALASSFNDMADYIAEFTNNLNRNVALLQIVEEENRRVAAVHSITEMIQVVETGLFRLQKATGCWLSYYLVESYDPVSGELCLVNAEGKIRRTVTAGTTAFHSITAAIRVYLCSYDGIESTLDNSAVWQNIPVIVREGLHFKYDFDVSAIDRILRAYALAVAGAVKTIDALELQARHARVSAEIETARAVQEGLLPNKIDVANMDVIALYQPVHNIGGDWYGYHFDPDNKIAYYYIGDITGHGFASALITGVVYGCIHAVNGYFSGEKHAQPRPELHIKRLAHVLNQVVHRAGLGQLMMTFMALGINIETGHAHCLNAGHRHGLWLRRNRQLVTALGMVPAIPLGYEAELAQPYQCTEVNFEHGDIFCLFTDGLVENATSTGKRLNWRQLKQTLLVADSLATTVNMIKNMTDNFWLDRRGKDDATIMFGQWR